MDVRWKCPKHGLADATGMPGGIYCIEEDLGRPHGVCGRLCKGPAVSTATGRTLSASPPPAKGEEFNPRFEGARKPRRPAGPELPASPASARDGKQGVTKVMVDDMAEKSVLQHGTRSCEICGRDLAGEHTRARAHKACRTKAASAPRTRQEPGRTKGATPAAAAPHTGTSAPPVDDRAPSKLPPEARVDFSRLPVSLSRSELDRIDALLESGFWGKTRGGCVERIVSRFLQSLDAGARRR